MGNISLADQEKSIEERKIDTSFLVNSLKDKMSEEEIMDLIIPISPIEQQNDKESQKYITENKGSTNKDKIRESQYRRRKGEAAGSSLRSAQLNIQKMQENINTTSHNLKQGLKDRVMEQTLIQTEEALD